MVKPIDRIPVVFWRSTTGREPVRAWLKGLPHDDRRAIGFDLAKLQIGWPVGMPLSRSLGDGLWELRSTMPSSRIARIIFTFSEGTIVLLNGFVKKSQKAPASELALARNRAKDMAS